MVMGDLVREVDVAVVGGGPGGYSAAFRAADLGLDTVVVDADGRLGGVCLHEGCIPSKALLHVAGTIAEAERAREYGVEFGAPKISLEPLRRWKGQRVVEKLAKGLASVARKRGVDLIRGRALFEDSRTLRVEAEGSSHLRFRHAIIATGSRPAPIPGVEIGGHRVMDSREALDLADIPGHLLVIGGGYIGLEVGTIYQALGSQVTLVEMTDGLLPGVDRDLVGPLARRLERLFRAIHLNTKVAAIRETDSGIEVSLEGQADLGSQSFDRVLVAVGRHPNSEGLGLERTKVQVDGRGFICVDERCRTTDERIYAVGDVSGEPMLAHRAMRQGKVAAEVISGQPAAFDNLAIPAVVFTDPEVAWCGLTEIEAQRSGRPVKVARFPWGASGRATTLGRSEGLTKLLLDPESGRLLGVGIVGPGAGELIAEGALALEMAVLAQDLASTIHTHPTLSESIMEAAEAFLGHATHLPAK